MTTPAEQKPVNGINRGTIRFFASSSLPYDLSDEVLLLIEDYTAAVVNEMLDEMEEAHIISYKSSKYGYFSQKLTELRQKWDKPYWKRTGGMYYPNQEAS